MPDVAHEEPETVNPPKITHGQKVTLHKFVEDNQRQLSTMGVLVAVTVFSRTIQPPWLAVTMSFCFVGMAVLLAWEVFVRIPREPSWPLQQFSNLLLVGTLALVAYWVYGFRETWRVAVPIAIPLSLPAFEQVRRRTRDWGWVSEVAPHALRLRGVLVGLLVTLQLLLFVAVTTVGIASVLS